jgi:molybdopterin-guanine dinucleotide biosynthesis protein A
VRGVHSRVTAAQNGFRYGDADLVLNPADSPLGAILAGGASRRFGSPKGLAVVGGRMIVERVRDALVAALDEAVLITNQPELYAGLGLRSRPDRHAGAGPVAGIEAALAWARDEGRPGALVAACDMPFLDPSALRLLVDRAGCDAVAVGTPPGGERPPMCMYLCVECLSAAEQVLASDDRSVRRLLALVSTEWVSSTEISRHRDPATMFFNVNTPDDLAPAELLARELDERA